jgi:hypothetical protein
MHGSRRAGEQRWAQWPPSNALAQHVPALGALRPRGTSPLDPPTGTSFARNMEERALQPGSVEHCLHTQLRGTHELGACVANNYDADSMTRAAQRLRYTFEAAPRELRSTRAAAARAADSESSGSSDDAYSDDEESTRA